MLTRRSLLWAGAGGWLAARTYAGDASGEVTSGPEEVVAALPGKRPLIQHAFRPPNFETPLAELAVPFTRNDAFFVRYHLAIIPEVDPAQWRLQVAGASAQRPLTLSLHELQHDFTLVTVPAVNQCAGNRRGLFAPRVPGVQWGNGGMGNARWRGVRLRDVLQRANISKDAVEVVFSGADSAVLPSTPAFAKSLPVDLALDENPLIAFEMNGEPLPHWNGAPARLVVPGWAGTYWVKHLTEIRIEPKPFEGFWMRGGYRIPTGVFPGRRFVTQETPETTPVTEILVNSLIVSPAPGSRLQRGRPAQLRGKAWDGGSGIARVEVSVDGRQSWREATLGADLGRFAWREFHYGLDTSRAGPLEVAVRAHSRSGATQPDKLIVNPSGYHDNIVQTLAVEVA